MLHKGDICPNNCANDVFGFHKRVLDSVPHIEFLKTGEKKLVFYGTSNLETSFRKLLLTEVL